jgi:hypothetical protein
MQVVVPSVSRAAVLQGAALTTFVEIPFVSTSSLPGPGYIWRVRSISADVTLGRVSLRDRSRA